LTYNSARNDNERFVTMLFVAAMFHGVLILGVSFSDINTSSETNAITSMDVVLLAREYEKNPESSDAVYLAQQNLAGAGNTLEDTGIRVAYGQDEQPVTPGPENDGTTETEQQAALDAPAGQMLYARAATGVTGYEQRERAIETLQARTGFSGTANSVDILAMPDVYTALKSAKPRELIVSASTRESRIAAYLDNWKRRVERVGTMNFPRAALNIPSTRNPVLEVNIRSDGKLQEAIILQSSGSRELDMAAVEILRLASPFDPFPDYLRNDYDVLKFSYEWQFSGNRVGRMKALSSGH
jgi:protein TonB